MLGFCQPENNNNKERGLCNNLIISHVTNEIQECLTVDLLI